jgi:predicted adenine nucleotide alpha hydrolase (AANH) superfamily ATPase
MYIKTEDPDLPAYYYDPLIHPIPAYKSRRTAVRHEEEEVGAQLYSTSIGFGTAGRNMHHLEMLCNSCVGTTSSY